MSKQIAPITERQLELITRAHCDADGLIEPFLKLKGGAKLKMIASLANRSLISQIDGQWRITRTAIAIIKGEASPEAVLAPITTINQASRDAAPQVQAQGIEASESAPAGRAHSKQALVIEMLKRPAGVTIAQICKATAWQAHTTRGFLAGTVKKKLALEITSRKTDGSDRTYHIATI